MSDGQELIAGTLLAALHALQSGRMDTDFDRGLATGLAVSLALTGDGAEEGEFDVEHLRDRGLEMLQEARREGMARELVAEAEEFLKRQ